MILPRLTRGAVVAAASMLALTLSACGSSEEPAADAGAGTTEAAPTTEATESAAPTTEPTSDEPFGEGCAAVPTDATNEGSFQGMTDDPVATAASNNPVLSTLVEAVSAANLVDTLNGQEGITVLAPANPAFEAVPPDALNALLADQAQLTAVLTHHVIGERLTPEQLAGEQTTLNGDTVTIEGSGEDFTVASTVTGQPATVICGNVQTANATVYILDQVLAPPAA
ncbi:fasciclin domain-containing protein [Geodermatophilus sp. YIM 151500]|uniref:fasciclin domain-containing protein n=1 Tax=Geodermatophilus sp. YIM 151500 TaxID=2984531 RepID=UPI0021E3FAD2|nr:fasciclin domain-containing protein [Geodermatophilus sp. YIM 151500]MCV2490239.1 fasciclin domain-containing protein [Geodermatophilus sp. YIM 151500]